MKNIKGFVMVETLVVTVFLVTIFTFIYVSIVPLIGIYEDGITREGDIDIVYKLYNIRKMILGDANKNSMTSARHATLTCSNFSNQTYCNKMMQFMGLNNYLLIYVDDIYDNMSYINNQNKDLYNYISKYQIMQGPMVILMDKNNGTMAHLMYDN